MSDPKTDPRITELMHALATGGLGAAGLSVQPTTSLALAEVGSRNAAGERCVAYTLRIEGICRSLVRGFTVSNKPGVVNGGFVVVPVGLPTPIELPAERPSAIRAAEVLDALGRGETWRIDGRRVCLDADGRLCCVATNETLNAEQLLPLDLTVTAFVAAVQTATRLEAIAA